MTVKQDESGQRRRAGWPAEGRKPRVKKAGEPFSFRPLIEVEAMLKRLDAADLQRCRIVNRALLIALPELCRKAGV